MVKHQLFYSAATGGFYAADVHGDRIPADATPITPARHRELLAGQAAGRQISVGSKGQPVLAPLKRVGIAERRQAAIHRLDREVRQRILAVATITDQLNDNAALAAAALQIATVGATSIDVSAALDRRARIDRLRAAAARIRACLSRADDAELAAFDPLNDQLWLEPK